MPNRLLLYDREYMKVTYVESGVGLDYVSYVNPHVLIFVLHD